MKRTLIMMMPAVLLLGLLSGCGDNFPDEELHFGLEQKTRPFAVVIEPPEAQPGEEVTVTLLGHSPRPEALDISWRVALDYDLGLYEVDEIERNYRPVPSGAPTFDLDGFFTQSFTWTVPDSTILLSSALPEVLNDPILANLARVALGLEAGAPVPKSQVDSWLGQLSHLEYLSMDPDEQAVVAALADRFACQVRLRATLDDGDLVDVTRNLTVRHARRLPTANVNENTFVDLLQLVVLEKRDAEESDLHDQDVPRQVYWLSTEPDRPGLVVEVPFYRNRSYFLILNFDLQQYEAPTSRACSRVRRGRAAGTITDGTTQPAARPFSSPTRGTTPRCSTWTTNRASTPREWAPSTAWWPWPGTCGTTGWPTTPRLARGWPRP